MGCGKANSVVTSPRSQHPPTQFHSSVLITPASFVCAHTNPISEDYTFHEFIGQGGFAQVRRVTHKATGAIRAVKVIHKAGLDLHMIDERHQLREFRLLSQLDHHSILRVFDLYEDKMRYYLVLEYCPSGELFDLITRRKSFCEAEAAQIMVQMASAVAYCHEKKIIHRDLKPENVLLEGDGHNLNVKIADFGSSSYLDAVGRMNGFCGSPYYIAPEVFSQCYNEKCDLWSLGIILYILLTGKPPYAGRDEHEILHNVIRGDLRISVMDNISTEGKDLVHKLLTKSVKDRISAQEMLGHPWLVGIMRNVHADCAVLASALSQMRAFHHISKLKEAILTYIATQIMSQIDTSELKQAFLSLDRNFDGKISHEELLSLYRKTLGEIDACQEVTGLISNVDTDKSGFIDYSEFLKASLDRSRHLSKQNLERTFHAFDTDRSGTISAVELRQVMRGVECWEEGMWESLIREADTNGDGLLDLKEFQSLIMKRM